MANKERSIKINFIIPSATKQLLSVVAVIIVTVFIGNVVFFNETKNFEFVSDVAEVSTINLNIYPTYVEDNNEKLLFAVQLNRHGAKTPGSFVDLTKELFYGSPDSQLTFSGFAMNEYLGQWTKERYNSILGSTYNENELAIFTNAKERSFFSAIAWAKGLYPDNVVEIVYLDDMQKINKNRNYSLPPIHKLNLNHVKAPIKIQVLDPHKDNILNAWKCKESENSTLSFDKMFNITKIYNITDQEIKEAVDEILEKYPAILKELKGDEDIYTLEFVDVLDGFLSPVQFQFNNTFLNISEKTTNFMIKAVLNKWYSPRILESQSKRISVSGLFKNMIKYYNATLNNTESNVTNTRFVMFSGHDGSIIDLLCNFIKMDILEYRLQNFEKYSDFLFPPIASNFVIELYANNLNEKYIKFLYNGEYITELTILKYNNRLNGIKFEDFRDFIISRIDKAYDNIYCYGIV